MITLLVALVFAVPCPHAVSVVTGDVAACDGALIPEKALVHLLEDQSALALVRATLDAERREHELDIGVCQGHWDLERKSRLECERDKSPPPPQKRAFYEEPVFIVLTTAVATAGLVVGLTYAVNAAGK